MNKSDPECFGKWKAKSKKCQACEFRQSCEYFKTDKQETDAKDRNYANRKGFRTFIEGLETKDPQGSVEDLAGILEDYQGEDNGKYTHNDLLSLMRFMLELTDDHWLREAIKEKLKLKSSKTLAEIAKDQGVSRQCVDQGVSNALKKILGFRMKNTNPKLSNKLNPEEYHIYYLRTKYGLNLREIAGRMGYSLGRLHRKTQKITAKIGSEWNNIQG